MQERFKKIRSHYGLSQAQFAQKIQVSPGFISNVETGRSNVSEKTINAICEAFPICKEWICLGEGEMFLPGKEGNEVDKTEVGGRVKKVRKEADLTQEEFAKRIGYSKIQVHSVESGKVIPSNQFLEKVSIEFGTDYQWLMTGEGQADNNTDPVDDELIEWLRRNPDVARELRIRGGLD